MKALHLFCFLLWLPFMAACNNTPTAPSTSSGTDPSPTATANSSASATATQAPTRKPTTMPTQTASAPSTSSGTATATQAPTRKPTIMPTQTASAPSTSSGTATATQAPTTTPIANTQPASQLIYTYQREGGFAGFCDTLTVRTQEAYWKSCKGQSATVPLNPETTQQLQQLLTQYAPYQNSSEDNPGGSDSMTESIQFQGNGNEEMTGEVEKMLRIIASELLGEAYQRQ